MRCANCGYDITDPNAVACPNCGQPLPVSLLPQDSAPPPPMETPPTPLVSTSQPSPIPTPPSTPLSTTSSQQTPRLSALLSPLPPVRKNKTRFVIPIIVGVVIIAALGGLLAVLNGQENTLVTSAANTTATANAPHTPVAVVAYQNTFASSADGWSHDQNCFLGTGGYHVSSAGCIAPTGSLHNVDIKVTVEQIKGSPTGAYGIILRRVESDVRYDVVIDSDSQWAADRCDGELNSTSADCHELAQFTSNSAIHGGLNTPNTIEVVAKGSHFDVSINGISVGSFDDSTYSEGAVGFVTSADIEVVYTDLVVTRFE